jgi:hypothetical protein
VSWYRERVLGRVGSCGAWLAVCESDQPMKHTGSCTSESLAPCFRRSSATSRGWQKAPKMQKVLRKFGNTTTHGTRLVLRLACFGLERAKRTWLNPSMRGGWRGSEAVTAPPPPRRQLSARILFLLAFGRQPLTRPTSGCLNHATSNRCPP